MVMQNRKIPDAVRNGIQLPVIRVDYQDYDLEKMAQDDLLALKIQIDSEKDTIEYQLSQAAAGLRADGEYADPKWYSRAKFAARTKSQQSQAIQAYLGKKKRNSPVSLHLDGFFMDAARDMLSADVFDVIMEEAKTRRDDETARRLAQGIPIADRVMLSNGAQP